VVARRNSRDSLAWDTSLLAALLITQQRNRIIIGDSQEGLTLASFPS
jgi:hypothetical protein